MSTSTNVNYYESESANISSSTPTSEVDISSNSLADLLLLIANITIGCIGLIGNTFVVVVIVGFTSMYKQIANFFVINQSIIDAVSSLLAIAQLASSFAPNIVLIPNHFASEFYCRVWQSQLLLWGAYAASTYNLVVLTIERYIKIVHPIAHKNSFTPRRAKFLLLFVWLFGFLQVSYGIPTTIIIDSSCSTNALWPNEVTQQVVAILFIAIQYWIPLLVFIVSYSKMIRIFRRIDVHNEKEPHETTLRNTSQRAQRNLTKTVIMVSIGFFFCWSMNEWYYFAFLLGAPINFSGPFFNFTVVLVSMHCCINPFIYIANYQQFRSTLRKIFRLHIQTMAPPPKRMSALFNSTKV